MYELFVCLRLSESTQPGRKTIEAASHIKALLRTNVKCAPSYPPEVSVYPDSKQS